MANTINAVHDGKFGFNTLWYTTALLYSYWMYSLWHGKIRAQMEEIQTETFIFKFSLKTLSPSIPLMYICFVVSFMKQLFRVQF